MELHRKLTFRRQWTRYADHVMAAPRVATWYDGTAQRLRLSYYVDEGEARFAVCEWTSSKWSTFAQLRWGRGGKVMPPAEAERRARAWLAAEAQRRFGASAACMAVANPVGVRRHGHLRTVMEV